MVDQPGVFDSHTESTSWDDARTDLTLTGDGATVEVVDVGPGDGDRPCAVELIP